MDEGVTVPEQRRPEREIGIRELRNAGKVVAELAAAGAVGRVTSGGRLVGWLVPASPAVRRSNLDERGELIDADRFSAELDEAAALLDDVTLLVVDRDVLDRAAAVEAPMVRTSDAIHLATAVDLNATIIEFVTYDRRLAKLAEIAGFEVVSPS